MTNYDDQRNIKRRMFFLDITMQGSSWHEGEWDVSSQADLDEFRAEILARFTEHLDACLSNGKWAFSVDSYEPVDS